MFPSYKIKSNETIPTPTQIQYRGRLGRRKISPKFISKLTLFSPSPTTFRFLSCTTKPNVVAISSGFAQEQERKLKTLLRQHPFSCNIVINFKCIPVTRKHHILIPSCAFSSCQKKKNSHHHLVNLGWFPVLPWMALTRVFAASFDGLFCSFRCVF